MLENPGLEGGVNNLHYLSRGQLAQNRIEDYKNFLLLCAKGVKNKIVGTRLMEAIGCSDIFDLKNSFFTLETSRLISTVVNIRGKIA